MWSVVGCWGVGIWGAGHPRPLLQWQSSYTCLHQSQLAGMCPTLCSPMDCSPPGSSVHGILQARLLEWVAIPFSRGILRTQGSDLCILTSPALAGGFFTTSATWEVQEVRSLKPHPERLILGLGICILRTPSWF